MVRGKSMKQCIEKKQCIGCKHYMENRYHYYTHDNRMVEYHVHECQRQQGIGHTTDEIKCKSFEKKKRF